MHCYNPRTSINRFAGRGIMSSKYVVMQKDSKCVVQRGGVGGQQKEWRRWGHVNSSWNLRKIGRSDSMFVGRLRSHIVSPRAWHDVTVPPPRAQPSTAAHVEAPATPTRPTNTRAIPALAYLCILFLASTRSTQGTSNSPLIPLK